MTSLALVCVIVWLVASASAGALGICVAVGGASFALGSPSSSSTAWRRSAFFGRARAWFSLVRPLGGDGRHHLSSLSGVYACVAAHSDRYGESV